MASGGPDRIGGECGEGRLKLFPRGLLDLEVAVRRDILCGFEIRLPRRGSRQGEEADARGCCRIAHRTCLVLLIRWRAEKSFTMGEMPHAPRRSRGSSVMMPSTPRSRIWLTPSAVFTVHANTRPSRRWTTSISRGVISVWRTVASSAPE